MIELTSAKQEEPMSYSSSMAKDLAFGVPWNPLRTDKESAEKLSRGVLELPPHPAWKMPATLNWSANPFGEINWVAQFHMLRWLDPLRRQAENGEVKHLDTWVHIARSWIEDNPPGRGKASYSWGDMVEAARAVTFCLALPILEEHRPEAIPTVLTSIREHGEWLADESHIRTGNHALQQHQGLLVIGAVLSREDWTNLAIERSRAMLRSSYDGQGINEEGAVQYHQINYSWWNALARRVRAIRGETPPEFELVQRAPMAMAHATRPDGNYELIGDTEIFSPRGVGHPATDYIASDGDRGAAPRERSVVYASGYVFGRSTWGDSTTRFSEADFFSLRFGPQNRIHGHMDGMALTLFHKGESLLVDSGKYAYDAKDPFREHFLSRESHNSVSIAGVNYDKTSVVELTNRYVSDACSHFRFEDTGYSGVVLTRDVLISLPERLIVIIDSFSADAPVTARQHWHLNPAAGHRKEDDSIYTVTPNSQMRLAFSGTGQTTVVQGATHPIQGWYSPTWRKKVGNRTITAEASGTQGRIMTVLSYGTAPNHLSIEHLKTTADGIEGFSIMCDETRFTALLGPKWGNLASGERNEHSVRQVIEDESD